MGNNSRKDTFFWIALLTIPLSLAAWFGYSYKKQSIRFEESKNQWQEHISNYNAVLQELSFYRILELQAEGEVLENVSVKDTSGSTHNLYDLMPNNPVIFRFWEESCDVCLKDNLSLLKNISTPQVILLGSFSSFNSFKQYVRTNGLKNVFWVTDNSFFSKVPMEQYQLIYYFELDKSKLMHRVFIPLKEYPKHTNSYLDWVKERKN